MFDRRNNTLSAHPKQRKSARITRLVVQVYFTQGAKWGRFGGGRGVPLRDDRSGQLDKRDVGFEWAALAPSRQLCHSNS